MLHRSVLIVLWGWFSASLIAAPARAADPRIGNITPPGAQRGTEMAVILDGQRIGKSPQSLLWSKPGIEVRSLTAENDNRLKAELTISPQCELGIHPVRVVTASGISNLMTLHIGALTEISEQEPNNDFAAPQAVEMDVVVNGVVTNLDVDYYAVQLAAGDRLSVEVEGLRLGRTFFDPAIAVLAADRNELAARDDTPLLQQDPHCSIIAPEAGRYIIAVRESAFRGNNACKYRLHIGRFPRPSAVYPPGGQPGEQLEVRWIGDARGDRTETITLPEQVDGDYRLTASDDHGISPSGVPVRITGLPNGLEVEPNNGRAEATTAPAPAALTGIVEAAGDIDFFRFAAKKGSVYDVRIFARNIRSPLDPVVRLFDGAGKSLAANDDFGGKPDSYFRWTAPADGDYFLSVRDHQKRGGPEFVYRVEVGPPQPTVDLRIEEQRRYFATVADVPRGGRIALMATAARRDMGGELQLILNDLPQGVTATVHPLAANYNRIPIILAAAADAPLGGALAAISTENGKVKNNFQHQTWLVRGRNNRPMWNYFDDRLPIAVTEPLPFQLQLVAPKSPLVKNGSKDLRVVAQRSEGFDGPISVWLMYNPPGVASNRSRKIEQGQTETTIPATANGNARVGDWQVAVFGQANVNGRAVVASEFATLRLAEPFVALQFQTTTTEQGSDVEFPVGIEVKTPFEGAAALTLVGLPPGVTTTPLEITKGTTSVVFPLAVAEDAQAGRHQRVFCQLAVVENGEPVAHTIGYGELRVDPKLPPEETVAQQP